MSAKAPTIENLTEATALHLIASHLNGDPRHGDAASGFYVDAASVTDHGVEITIGDEAGRSTTVTLARVLIGYSRARSDLPPVIVDPRALFIEPRSRQ